MDDSIFTLLLFHWFPLKTFHSFFLTILCKYFIPFFRDIINWVTAQFIYMICNSGACNCFIFALNHFHVKWMFMTKLCSKALNEKLFVIRKKLSGKSSSKGWWTHKKYYYLNKSSCHSLLCIKSNIYELVMMRRGPSPEMNKMEADARLSMKCERE